MYDKLPRDLLPRPGYELKTVEPFDADDVLEDLPMEDRLQLAMPNQAPPQGPASWMERGASSSSSSSSSSPLATAAGAGRSILTVEQWNNYAGNLFKFYNTPRCPYDNCRRLVDPAHLHTHLHTCQFKPQRMRTSAGSARANRSKSAPRKQMTRGRGEAKATSQRLLCVYCRGYFAVKHHKTHTKTCRQKLEHQIDACSNP